MTRNLKVFCLLTTLLACEAESAPEVDMPEPPPVVEEPQEPLCFEAVAGVVEQCAPPYAGCLLGTSPCEDPLAEVQVCVETHTLVYPQDPELVRIVLELGWDYSTRDWQDQNTWTSQNLPAEWLPAGSEPRPTDYEWQDCIDISCCVMCTGDTKPCGDECVPVTATCFLERGCAC